MEDKTLIYDVEISPIISAVWGYFEQNVVWEVDDWFIMSIAYKWEGEKKVHCLALPSYKGYCKNKKSDKELLQDFSKVWNKADKVVAHCGDSFDAKKINARLIINGLPPLKPVAQIDTKKIAKRYFNFPSNKLQYLGDHFGLGGKEETGGYHLWQNCLVGDMKAWKKMIKYNKRDVDLLEKVYWKMKPWVQGLYEYNDGCPGCGGINFQHRGFKSYNTGDRQRYQCRDCGRWFQDKLITNKTVRKYI